MHPLFVCNILKDFLSVDSETAHEGNQGLFLLFCQIQREFPNGDRPQLHDLGSQTV